MTRQLHLLPMHNKWAWALFQDMERNYWLPTEVSTGSDRLHYNSLNPDEAHLFKHALARLTTADIQIGNNAQDGVEVALERLGVMTEPVLKFPLSMQIMQERVHAQSYQEIIESILSMTDLEQELLYRIWENTPAMRAQVEFANSMNNTLLDPDTTFAETLAALWWYYNIYEGCWFMNGFNPIYSLAHKRHVLNNTVEQLKYIQRDERTHITYGQQMFKLAAEELTNDEWAEFHDLVLSHVRRSEHLEKDWIMFLCPEPMFVYQPEHHMQHWCVLVNMRFQETMQSIHYPHTQTPFTWLSLFQLNNESNFFERNVDAYQRGGLSWDD